MSLTKGYFSSNKKLVRKFSRMFWIETIFCLVVVAFSALSQFYQQKQADETYGKWTAAYYDISENDLSELKLNPLFETVGAQTIEGTLVQKNTQTIESSGPDEEVEIEQQFGSIGIADPSFFEMAGLKLKTGHLPQNENEIAMEAAVLDGMGISYETGQPIELTIRKENPDDRNDFEEITETFVLSGVIENYSNTWSSNGTLIRSFISQPIPSERIQNKKNIIAFIEPKKGYEDGMDTMSTEDRMIETNVNRLLSRDPFSSGNIPATLCVLLSFLFLTILQAESLFVWIWKRRQEVRMLRILGVHKKILIQDIFTMLFKACRIPYLILILVLAMLIPLRYLPALIVYVLLLQILVLIAAGVLIYQVPLLKKSPKKKKLKAKIVSKTITAKEISRRFLGRYKWIYRLQIFCLILLQISLLYFGNHILESTYILNETVGDFLIEGAPVMDPISAQTNTPIPASVLSTLEQWTDIKLIEKTRTIRNLKTSWENIQDSFLYNPDTQQLDPLRSINIRVDENGNAALYTSIDIIGDPVVADRTIEQLKKEDVIGQVDWENWKKGGEAILYLPKIKMGGDRSAYGLNPALDGKVDKSIQPGDMITLEDNNGVQHQIPVSGILRNYDPKALGFQPLVYGLIIGGTEIDTLRISLNDIRNQVPVEIALSKMASENNLVFHNNLAENERVEQYHKVQIILNLFTILILFSVLIVILQLSRIMEKEAIDQYLGIFKRIGVSDSYRRQIIAKTRHRLLIILFASEVLITLVNLFLLYRQSDRFGAFLPYLILACLILLIFFLLDLSLYIRSD
ncbi:hypothetical protein AAK899_10115 [Erysipelotrichaceae bacterium 51-3]